MIRRPVRALAAASLAAGLLLLTVIPSAPAEPGQDGVASLHPEFVPGSVTGRARALRVGGFTGGLEYALTFATALARAQGTQANAQAQAIDLGVFGLILTQPTKCTGAPILPPEQEPRPLRVSSVGGAHSGSKTTLDGQFTKAGTEKASATTEPKGSAETRIGALDLSPAIKVDGLQSLADASIDAAKQTRSTTASTSVGAIDIAGIVRLEGVRWSVERTTGKIDEHSAVFTVGRILLAGAPLPTAPAELGGTFTAINGVLAAVGVALEPPAVLEKADGSIELTPLKVRIGGVDELNPLLGALFEGALPLREAILTAAKAAARSIQ